MKEKTKIAIIGLRGIVQLVHLPLLSKINSVDIAVSEVSKSKLKSLSDIFYLRYGWVRKQSSKQKRFNKKSLAGGGVVLDLGIVLLDSALWLLDFTKVKSVS